MSLGELFDFILRFLMRSWISFASVGARNNEFFELIRLQKCLQATGNDFIFADRDFPTSANALGYERTQPEHTKLFACEPAYQDIS